MFVSTLICTVTTLVRWKHWKAIEERMGIIWNVHNTFKMSALLWLFNALSMHEYNCTDLIAVCLYNVEIHTGTLPNSSTDAKVCVELTGKQGDTGRRKLLQPISESNEKCFQAGQVWNKSFPAQSCSEICFVSSVRIIREKSIPVFP